MTIEGASIEDEWFPCLHVGRSIAIPAVPVQQTKVVFGVSVTVLDQEPRRVPE